MALNMATYTENTIKGLFAFANRKVNLKNGVPADAVLKSIDYNKNTNFIAAGGTNGIVRIVRLTADGGNSVQAVRSERELSTLKNLSVNTNLDGHTGTVVRVMFNEKFQKLATADSNGLVIVFGLRGETWHEEMMNNRNKSPVVDLCWSHDGENAAIAYQDGNIVIGTKSGTRVSVIETNNQLTAICVSLVLIK